VNGKLPEHQRAGFARLVAAWKDRNEQRFRASMDLLGRLLAQAARESQELAVAPAGLRQLVSAGEREGAQRAREAAAGAVLERLRGHEGTMLAELVRLHRIPPPPASLLAARPGDPFL